MCKVKTRHLLAVNALLLVESKIFIGRTTKPSVILIFANKDSQL